MDQGTANSKHYRVGQEIGVAVRGPARSRSSGSSGSPSSAACPRSAAPRWRSSTCRPRRSSSARSVSSTRSASAKTAAQTTPKLSPRSRRSCPRHARCKTAAQQAKSDASDTTSFLTFLQDFLLAFGWIALFVGAFVIINTLSITIAQRTREFATLRAIGATRNQVLGSVMLEALVIGLLASVVGLFLGLLLAKGIGSALQRCGNRPAEDLGGVQHADDRRVARRGHGRDPAGVALAGVPLDPRAADRGRS